MRSTCGGIACRSRRIHGRPASAGRIPRSRRSRGSMRTVCANAAPAGHLSHAVHTSLRVDTLRRARVALRRRVMMNRQLRRIDEPCARAIQVEREQRFLAAEKVAWVIAARAQIRIAPERRRAGQQPEDRPPRQRDARVERAIGHQFAGRVLAFFRAHQHARGDGRDVRIRVEQVCCLGDRAGRPPRIVVAERDVARARDAHAEIAPGRAHVAGRMHERHVCEALAHECGGRVVRTVVDHDDRRTVGQRGEARQRAREFVRAPVGEHHRGHARLARRERCACGRYPDVLSHSSCQYVSGSWRSARI